MDKNTKTFPADGNWHDLPQTSRASIETPPVSCQFEFDSDNNSLRIKSLDRVPNQNITVEYEEASELTESDVS